MLPFSVSSKPIPLFVGKFDFRQSHRHNQLQIFMYLMDIKSFIGIGKLSNIADISTLEKVKAHDLLPISTKIDAAFLS